MTRSIITTDVRDLLARFAAAIELDQIRVDALPAHSFHDQYEDDDDDDSWWRGWRLDHVEYVNLILSTVDALPPVILEELTWIATSYEPEFVGEAAIRLFREVVSGNYASEDVDTATAFFKMLINWVRTRPEGQSVGEDAPSFDEAVAQQHGSLTNLSRPWIRI